ncbi:hypothetical protein AVEN_144812-1 [Araneus ventricosus]|uniref:Reverse transcriptase/retrotransposon-derived protein RNase H-like domain-containing protein n=1 Tax=Araneus ventricosus TaxID=182803 RepID=A0A4Y2WNM9_ARAVE|nr:hypothetical protein AVEN_144812-1 [Araneus ventricosus]
MLSDFRVGITTTRSFQKLMQTLLSDPVLRIFDPAKETIVTTDASLYGLGATICQKQADERRMTIANASRTLTPTESCYEQIEKEVLVVVRGCEIFRDCLTGIYFRLETDHKSLSPIFSNKNLDGLSPLLQRIKLRIMKFSYIIIHIQEKNCLPQINCQEHLPPKKLPAKIEAEIEEFIQMKFFSNTISQIRRTKSCTALR